MSTSTVRETEILAVVDRFLAEHDEWAASTVRSDTPDKEYWAAYDDMMSVTSEGDVPRSLRPIVKAVEALQREGQKYEEQNDTDKQMPHHGFWQERENLARVRTTQARDEVATLKPLEPIQLLRSQGVSDEQIARIYGLFLPNGEPASHYVQREIDKPGSVIDANWVDPRVREIREQRAADDADGDDAATDGLAARRKRAEKEEKPCPESPHELWEQGVSVEQSAKMLKMLEVKVAAMFERFAREKRAEKEGDTEPSPKKPKTKSATKTDESIPDASDIEGLTAEQVATIAEMSREGSTPQEIGADLGLDGRKIAGAIRTINARNKALQTA